MKYYTHDLLNRFGSADDHIASAAQSEWEAASDRYVAQLEGVRPRLSKKMVEFLDRFNLHDATVMNLGRSESEFFVSVLLDSPTREWLTLRYQLACGLEPETIRHEIEPQDQTPAFQWLYDELDVMTSGQVTVFTHSILFTNGFELRLFFFDMDFTVVSPWLYSTGNESTAMPMMMKM